MSRSQGFSFASRKFRLTNLIQGSCADTLDKARCGTSRKDAELGSAVEWLPDAIAWVQGKIDELSRKPLEEKKALPPAQRNLPAPAPYLDETPFLKFVEEIQSAHEEVRNILQPLMSNSFNLCLELGLELGRRSGMRSGSIKGMDPTRNITDLLQHAIFSDLRQALIYPERHLADYANPGYALLGIVRQLNAR